jgi:hypothetical protein
MNEELQSYGEENHIRAECPGGQSFSDFIREYRGPNASIQIRWK